MLRPSFLSLAILFLVSCARAPEPLVLSGPTMGTQYNVKLAEPAAKRADIQREIDTVLERIDLEMSTYRGDSVISRFNAYESTEWFDVPASLVEVVSIAHRVSELSDGAFDITAGPLISAWGFGATGEPDALPTAEQIQSMRAYVDYALVETRTQPAALRKRDVRVKIDVSGIAPGYAVDLIAARLTARGFKNFMIDIGGEVLARGVNSQGAAWRIAIERPVDAEPMPFKIVELSNRSITTSGEYRHYFERAGKRYSHTIDPRTAQPIESHGSVAILGERSAEIDAWATALNVLGPDRGLALAERESLAVLYIVVGERGQLHARTSMRFDREVVTIKDE